MKLIITTFFLGILLGVFITAQFPYSSEQALPFTSNAQEWLSPSDHIKESQIHVYENRVVIDLKAEWARLENTNSMDPFFDENANVLQVIPEDENEISAGDIVSYKTDKGTIIHRIIEIEEDEEGTYYIVKGDNNKLPDNHKVRFSDIEKVLVGVLY